MNNPRLARETLGSFMVLDDQAPVRHEPELAKLLAMPEDAYHKHPALSKTKLSTFIDSPEVYAGQYVTGTVPCRIASRPMIIGDVVHKVLLDGCDLDDRIAVIPLACLKSDGAINTRGAAYQDWILSIGDREPVKQKQCDQINACLDAVRKSPLWPLLEATKYRERALFWIDPETGIECRCKPDFFLDDGDHVVCYDLKISPAISPQGFRKQVKRFKYWLQDAHYSAGLADLYMKPVQFRFWVIEPVPPYRIVCYWLDPKSTRTTAYDRWRAAVNRFALCQAAGIWKDEWGGAIVLNEWDFGDQEEETLNWEESD